MYTVPASILLVSILLLVAGYIIRKRKLAQLVAGYDPEKVHDKEGYIKWASASIFIVGIVGLITGGLLLIMPEITIFIVAGYVILIGILALVMVIGEKRYKRR